jgi:hypothetical protein
MNAKQFQSLLKESEGILRDEDFAPKGGEEITRDRMSYDGFDKENSIISLLDEVIQSAEEIVARAKVCQQAVESGDSEYMKDIEDLESVIDGSTGDLVHSMSEIMDAINDAEEEDEDEDYMRESKETK